MILNESMHPLITPPFTGTNEETITAVSYWVETVTRIRSLFTVISNYDNREAIIKHLEQEIAAMKAELENTSATVDDEGNMSQPRGLPAVAGAPAPEQDAAVDLSHTDSLIASMKKASGIEPKAANPLAGL